MILLFPFMILGVSFAEYIEKCSNFENSVKLNNSSSHLDGRYSLEWCYTGATEHDILNIIIKYLNVSEAECNANYASTFNTITTHSSYRDKLDIKLKCSNVCFSTFADLIFTGCYVIMTGVESTLDKKNNTYFYIKNNITDASFFDKKQVVASARTIRNNTQALTWFLGYLPITSYEMWARPSASSDNLTSEEFNEHRYSLGDRNCTYDQVENKVDCILTMDAGCYLYEIELHAPWAKGSLFDSLSLHRFESCVLAVRVETAEGENGSRWPTWVLVLAVLMSLAVLTGGATLWVRRRSATSRSKKMLDKLLNSGNGGRVAVSPQCRGPVVLVLAREGSAGSGVERTLRDVLQAVAPGRVVVVGGEGVMDARAAPAPVEWLRATLGAEDARVLLLHSPALQLHLDRAHTHPQPPHHCTVDAALLGTHAVYREPRFGDGLVRLALRLLTDTAPGDPLAYTRYFVLQIEGLQMCERVPGVTPLARYVLPRDLTALLQQLSPASDVPHIQHLETELCTELSRFVDTVRERPDYLQDELVFL